jgi:hypothetical protein
VNLQPIKSFTLLNSYIVVSSLPKLIPEYDR